MKASGNRRSASKRAEVPTTVDGYLSRVPEPARTALKKMRAAIRSAVPRDSTEIISYRMPAFRRNRVLVWYAAFSDHCSLFPTGSIVEAFKGRTQAVQDIERDDPVPAGQAAARWPHQENGESASGGQRCEEAAVAPPPSTGRTEQGEREGDSDHQYFSAGRISTAPPSRAAGIRAASAIAASMPSASYTVYPAAPSG
jgi:hypothetical protein